MKIKYRMKVPEHSDEFTLEMVFAVVRCMCLSGLEISPKIYGQLTPAESSLFETIVTEK